MLIRRLVGAFFLTLSFRLWLQSSTGSSLGQALLLDAIFLAAATLTFWTTGMPYLNFFLAATDSIFAGVVLAIVVPIGYVIVGGVAIVGLAGLLWIGISLKLKIQGDGIYW